MKRISAWVVWVNIATAIANGCVATYQFRQYQSLVGWLFVVLGINNLSVAVMNWTRSVCAEGAPK